ncbi:MAG: class I SAM-dependent methyltransferase [Pseudomonadota bacterium]
MNKDFINTFQQEVHPLLVDGNADDRARQEYVKSLKTSIQQSLLPAISGAYFQRALPAFAAEKGRPPEDHREARKAFADDPLFKAYLSINRISQELQWTSVIDALAEAGQQLEDNAKNLLPAGGSLTLNPDLEVPKYVSSIDIHCMPGGYCGPDGAHALHTGALYDRGVYLYAMGYMGPRNDDMGRSVCNYVKRNHPDFKPRRILDLGCTVGHSTLPYAELFPEAEVHAIDVAAACVTYAHHRAEGLGIPVHFKQMNAESTSYEDGSFDLVVSHILLHETSNKAMPKIFHEAYRLLAPGGMMIHADLPPFDNMDAYTQLILDNETWYNNEPFWTAMRNKDQIAMSVAAGFAEDAVAFDTAPMAIMEFASNGDDSYSEQAAKEIEDREFEAGEYAPGGSWEVLVARKED